MVGQHSPLLEEIKELAMVCKWETETITWTSFKARTALQADKGAATLVSRSQMHLVAQIKWLELVN